MTLILTEGKAVARLAGRLLCLQERTGRGLWRLRGCKGKPLRVVRMLLAFASFSE